MGFLRCRYEGITLSNHVSEFPERESKHRDQSKSILRLQLYWLHLIDKIFSVIKPCSPIFIPQPWDEHADTGTTKATSPPSRSSVLTQYRDSRSWVATYLYSCLHFPFSGATINPLFSLSVPAHYQFLPCCSLQAHLRGSPGDNCLYVFFPIPSFDSCTPF